MQDSQTRRHLLIWRVGMPVGRALDPEPVDIAFLVDIGKPRHFGKFGMAVIDQRMELRPAETASKGRQLSGAEILLTKYQYRVLREGILDPGEGLRIQRLRQVDAECLGAERLTERTKFACDHRRSLLYAF